MAAKFITATSEWKRFSYTFTLTDSTANTSFLFAKATEAGNLEYCGMELELCNKATDWSLSPWDITNRLTKAEAAIVALGDTI